MWFVGFIMFNDEMLERINMVKDFYNPTLNNFSKKCLAQLIEAGNFENIMRLYDMGYRKVENVNNNNNDNNNN